MPSKFKQRLIKHLKHESYTPAGAETLADELRIPDEDRDDFLREVAEMADRGEVALGDEGGVTLPPIGREVVGRFKKHAKGFGFIIPNDPTTHGDLFVPPGQTGEALTGDEVRAEVVRDNRGRRKGSVSGRIVEILNRKQAAFTGQVYREGGHWWAKTDGKVLPEPVVLRDAESKHVKEGDKVVFEILHYPEGDLFGEGVITKVLGEAGEPDVETQAVIATYELPGDFPDEVNAEARRLTEGFEELMTRHEDGGIPFRREERWDLRDALITTIDPPDAKDYDDAISLERLGDIRGMGPGWRLGVHIADVANFIEPGKAIDREAIDRGNSCYLPRLVIPMLPEILSNGICSLQEGVPRFAKSVFLEYDERGNVVGRGFAATVIKSKKRMTYLEAQALIEGNEEEAKKHAKTDTPYTPEVKSAVREMDRLARVIRERRRKKGMIHLDLPEVELVFDEAGNVTDAVPEDDAFTHTIIEMFMVEANEAVATLFEEMGVPLIRRTHPEPVPGDTEGLRDFVKVAGYKIPKSPTREDLQGLLDATAGTPAAHAVHMAVLQTLTKAEYSPALVGHFALASGAYAHFTSPIRRYTDLTAHRSITKYLEFTKNGTEMPGTDEAKSKLGKRLKETDECPDEQKLAEIAGQCNRREQNATQAERELRSVLVMQYLEREHMGEELLGIVTGVMPNGVFVQLEKYLAEGMCKTEDLPLPESNKQHGGYRKAFWQLDKKTGALVERNSGRSYNIGDRVTVVISAIDLPKRQMDLVIADAGSREVGKAKRAEPGRDRAGLHGLQLGEVEEWKPKKTGAEKRAQRSRSRDKRKTDHRQERKDKGKRM